MAKTMKLALQPILDKITLVIGEAEEIEEHIYNSLTMGNRALLIQNRSIIST
jgi:hypothetical protein